MNKQYVIKMQGGYYTECLGWKPGDTAEYATHFSHDAAIAKAKLLQAVNLRATVELAPKPNKFKFLSHPQRLRTNEWGMNYYA